MKINLPSRIGVRTKITGMVFLTVVLLVVSLHRYHRGQIADEARAALLRRGEALAFSLAGECEYGLLSGNKQVLQRIAVRALSQSDVLWAVIFDDQGRLMAGAGQTDLAGKAQTGAELASRFRAPDHPKCEIAPPSGGTHLIYVPVHLQPSLTPVSDLDETAKDTTRQVGQTVGVFELGISDTATMLRLQRSGNVALSISLSVTVAACLVCVFMALHVTRPLQPLLTGIDKLASGQWETRVPENRSDEFGDLGHAFNRLAESIQRALKDTSAAAKTQITLIPLPPQIHAGARFADFEIISKIGEGGMGAVYKARQPILNRMVALKILPPHFAADADFITRFQREAATAAQFSHPHIVQVHQAGVSEGVHYIAMEFVEGRSLSHRLEQDGPLPAAEAITICLNVAEALQHAWQQGRLIHRDVKPGNIFLSNSGHVKLGDFGLVKTREETNTGLTKTGMALGSPHYISPEQVRGEKDIDFRADIYSLGCALYHMLSGHRPFNASNTIEIMALQITAPAPSILYVMPGCPEPIVTLLNKMLAKDRNARPGSYDELIAVLRQIRLQVSQRE